MKASRVALALALALSAMLAPPVARGRAAPRVVAAPRACAPGDVVHRLAPTIYSIEPSRRFRLDRASDAELACYGFGRRPPAGDTAAQAQWAAQARHLRYIAPKISIRDPSGTRPTALRRLARARTSDAPVTESASSRTLPGVRPSVAPRSGSNCYPATPIFYLAGCVANGVWAGYSAYYADNNNAYFSYAQARFTLPDVHFIGPNGYDNWVAPWVGLGPLGSAPDGSGTELWQAGVDAIDDPSYRVWFEDYGCGPRAGPNGSPNCPYPPGMPSMGGVAIYIQNLYVAPGDDVEVGVGASAGQGNYFVQDTTQGYYTGVMTFNPLDLGYDSTRGTPLTADAADFIVETDDCGSTQCDVQSMSRVHFYGALAQLNNGERRWIDGWNVTRYDLCKAESNPPPGQIPRSADRIGLPGGLTVDHGFYLSFDGTANNADCLQE